MAVVAGVRDRTKITLHKLSAKVLKRLDILPTECQVIFEPTLRQQNYSEDHSRSMPKSNQERNYEH